MRKRRLARLAGLESGTSPLLSSPNGLSCQSSPGTPGAPVTGPVTSSLSSPMSGVSPVSLTGDKSIDAAMETDDNNEKQFNNSGIDVDSGIENMEVEESDRKDNSRRSRVC